MINSSYYLETVAGMPFQNQVEIDGPFSAASFYGTMFGCVSNSSSYFIGTTSNIKQLDFATCKKANQRFLRKIHTFGSSPHPFLRYSHCFEFSRK